MKHNGSKPMQVAQKAMCSHTFGVWVVRRTPMLTMLWHLKATKDNGRAAYRTEGASESFPIRLKIAQKPFIPKGSNVVLFWTLF